jgi:hypothetical protein
MAKIQTAKKGTTNANTKLEKLVLKLLGEKRLTPDEKAFISLIKEKLQRHVCGADCMADYWKKLDAYGRRNVEIACC